MSGEVERAVEVARKSELYPYRPGYENRMMATAIAAFAEEVAREIDKKAEAERERLLIAKEDKLPQYDIGHRAGSFLASQFSADLLRDRAGCEGER